jgi:DNA topoisomerase IB
VKTADLNAAVKELAGEDHTCKDLRTWNATVLAAVALAAGAAEKGVPGSERARKRMVTAAVKQVSEHLGNTPTVARASYVDPRVLARFDDGVTVLPVLQQLEGCRAGLPADDASRAVLERAVVNLITG